MIRRCRVARSSGLPVSIQRCPAINIMLAKCRSVVVMLVIV
nr:MAG TPA: hypothetical protein [Caudoviricetes sp.]